MPLALMLKSACFVGPQQEFAEPRLVVRTLHHLAVLGDGEVALLASGVLYREDRGRSANLATVPPPRVFLILVYQVVALDELIEEGRRLGPLYVENPKLVADISRKAKWLRKAIQTFQESQQPKPAA